MHAYRHVRFVSYIFVILTTCISRHIQYRCCLEKINTRFNISRSTRAKTRHDWYTPALTLMMTSWCLCRTYWVDHKSYIHLGVVFCIGHIVRGQYFISIWYYATISHSFDMTIELDNWGVSLQNGLDVFELRVNACNQHGALWPDSWILGGSIYMYLNISQALRVSRVS